MATGSRIRMVLPSGEAKSVYCYSDGYPSYQVPLLKKYYNTTEKVRELLNLGALSILRARVKPEPGETHTFRNPVKDITIAYHRDRGDKFESGHADCEQYDYVWDGKNWYLSDGTGGKTKV